MLNKTNNGIAVINSNTDLGLYYKDLSKIKMLTEKEEYSLAVDVIEYQNIESAHKLIVSHLPLVVKIAYSFKGYGLPMADMVAEGNIGLIRAVSKFDPYKGFRLSTYAIHWIKAYITDYILNSWSLVKSGTLAGRKKLFFSLNKIKNKLQLDNKTALTKNDIKKISSYAKISERDVVEVNNMITKKDYYLQNTMCSDSASTFENMLEDTNDNPEEIVAQSQENNFQKKMIKKALKTLSDREQSILKQRYMSESPTSLEKIGLTLGISRERVRQIEVVALKKVKSFFDNNKITFA